MLASNSLYALYWSFIPLSVGDVMLYVCLRFSFAFWVLCVSFVYLMLASFPVSFPYNAYKISDLYTDWILMCKQNFSVNASKC